MAGFRFDHSQHCRGSREIFRLDFSRFLNNALGSLNEVVACLDLALDDDYITPEEHRRYIQWAGNIYRQLRAFSAKVRKSS